ncbi:MAG TPA: PQQ-binding-like beta-propeller repeat protein, partial [Planctomycetaceae bacterium]|nr:PQQ-binding-like beta-propeller repeat protein [Planctomycetaceae bacterium]
KQLALVYTNGTWFQMIGTKSGEETRWAFTHCEIYLRRTFKGTTKEMTDTVTGVVSGKQKPPPLNSKEKPGLGPEVEKPDAKAEADEKKAESWLRERDATEYRWSVIALPFLAPLAALLQLLFPGLLRDHWKRYRVVISILMTQSTLITLHWVLLRWFVKERSWWLMDDMLWAALVVVSLLGAVVACVLFALAAPERDRNVIRPAPVEYLALGSLLFAGLVWGCWLMWTGSSPFDQMAVVSLGALAAWLHLMYRSRRAASGRPMFLTTELVFLWGLVFAGAGLGLYLNTQQANQTAGAVSAEWPLFRGHPQRNGAVDVGDAGPRHPTILWTFDPAERKGRVRLHSSPTVVNGQVYIGGLHEVQTLAQGYLYCVSAEAGSGPEARKPGDRIWRFSAGGSLKPVFASPSVARGRVYFGEGYHQDQACRMFCLDAQNADEPLWSFLAGSHVESSPCLVGNRIYFGAGDDGVYCLELPESSGAPRKIWQHPDVHVDGAPVVADGKVLVGSVLGDIKQEFQALALDANTGEVHWKLAAPMPVAGSAAVSADAVYFGLGNGKFDHDAESPAGSVWKIDLASGKKA